MRSSSIARIKCYIILQGLEHSLAENLLRNFDIYSRPFLNDEEKARALERMRADLGESNWKIDDFSSEELIEYLDLGDLVNLLNRHAQSARNIYPEHITAATQLIIRREILPIRKRVMHPVRPLEIFDWPTLSELAQTIRKVAPSMIWDPLAIAVRRLSKEGAILDIPIPSFWAEESPVVHNLPPAEFDETGFIGRSKERKDLKKLLESDHRVITVVGEGGIGKTALALRVCNDLLEDTKSSFDRIVWVSLKTRYLTPEGVREVNEAIDSLGSLIDRLIEAMKITTEMTKAPNWARVIEQMSATRTLLVIDNLETIGEEIRGLVLEIPYGSRVLLTSRVGLGEIEVRYELPQFAPKDAIALFRSLVSIHNYKALKNLSQDTINQYVESMHHNPLLIKWFALAVGTGADPHVLLSKEGLDEPLNFCYANVYDRLDSLSKHTLSVLLAARRELTSAQLQDLTGSKYINFIRTCQELVRTSMVQRVSEPDGTMVFQVGGLVYEYLSRNHPPSDNLVKTVRGKIQEWQVEQDKSAFESEAYRYGQSVIHVEKADERISAQRLLRALRACRAGDFVAASEALARAEEITPAWWEVFRVRARVLEAQNRPIYEIEEAFEQSIKYKDSDVNRYHYAAYLIRINEFERAIEQVDEALLHKEALPMTFRSVKGLALMRMGRIDEAINEMEPVWINRSSDLPIRVGRAQGTQLADAYRRRGEQLLSLGRVSEAVEVLSKSADTIDETMRAYEYDRKLVETAVNIIATVVGRVGRDIIDEYPIIRLARKWDENRRFRVCAEGYYRTLRHFERTPVLEEFLPKVANIVKTSEFMKFYTGTIEEVVREKAFGYITSDMLGKVHFSQSSLVDTSQWLELQTGKAVKFQIIPGGRHKGRKALPHAVQMEIIQETYGLN